MHHLNFTPNRLKQIPNVKRTSDCYWKLVDLGAASEAPLSHTKLLMTERSAFALSVGVHTVPYRVQTFSFSLFHTVFPDYLI